MSNFYVCMQSCVLTHMCRHTLMHTHILTICMYVALNAALTYVYIMDRLTQAIYHLVSYVHLFVVRVLNGKST